ncbi:MAG: lactonase family protein [Bacteroidota bacterium]
MNRSITTLLLILMTLSSCQQRMKTFLFIGSYTDGQEKEGIYVYEFDQKSGELQEIQRKGEVINPSFLTISANGQYLYACTETRLETHGSVSAFRIDTLTGKIAFLNKQTAGGRNPVHLAVDQNNKYVVNSSYTDPGVGIFECTSDGRLKPYSKLIEFEGSSIIADRQEAAHIHSAYFSFDDQFLFAPDLGADKIRVLTFDKDNQLQIAKDLEVDTQPGSGPRHFTFHPNHRFAYGVEELSGTVTAYRYQAGQLETIASYFSYSKELEAYASADIHISPDGQFLYASNRLPEENTISIFKINTEDGRLALVGHQSTYGDHPRNFVIDPSGDFLLVANQYSGSVVVFKRDQQSGLLEKLETELQLDNPSCLRMRVYKK